jgi:hypothetical protein
MTQTAALPGESAVGSDGPQCNSLAGAFGFERVARTEMQLLAGAPLEQVLCMGWFRRAFVLVGGVETGKPTTLAFAGDLPPDDRTDHVVV